jgi:acetyltransferase-like isoleucine patch superfamily enzyme
MQNLAKKPKVYEYLLADVVTLLLEGLIYGLSLSAFYPAFSALAQGRLLAGLFWFLVGWPAACLIFLLLLASLKLAVGEVAAGRYFITSTRAYRWIAADRLVKIINRSPFRQWINDYSFFRYLYYRGMGAQVSPSLLLGQRVVIPEPYLMSIGRNVLIGDEAVISCHKVEKNVVTLERVEIGDDVLIGARAVILPGVRIGNGALVGANSMVPRGTIIAPGETWSGNPASKLELLARKR